MTKIHRNSPQSLMLAVTMSAGLGVMFSASANSYFIDLSSKQVTDLGSLEAKTINDTGQLAGTLAIGDDVHAFITGPNGVSITDLNALLNLSGKSHLDDAIAINNHGQAIAGGFVMNALSISEIAVSKYYAAHSSFPYASEPNNLGKRIGRSRIFASTPFPMPFGVGAGAGKPGCVDMIPAFHSPGSPAGFQQNP